MYIDRMRLLIASHTAMSMTPDGALWAGHPMGYDFWKRYLDVFEEVQVLARTQRISTPSPRHLLVTGPGVVPAPAPNFDGVRQAMTRYVAVRRAARNAFRQAEAVLLRIPQPFSQIVWGVLDPGRPYAVQVTSDPHDGLAPGANRHPLRPLLRKLLTDRVRRQCAGACAVAYVTRGALQLNYPAGPGAFAIGYSDVVVNDDAFLPNPRPRTVESCRRRIIMVGYLGQPYKGADLLIDAAAECVRDGLDLELEFVGGGRYQPEYEARAEAKGLEGRARFLGTLHSAAAVRERLDHADLFVLPSRVEGLPRAMIEAMARGLPSIGSRIGGIPELLDEQDLFTVNDAPALARKLREVLTDPDRLARMSARNLNRAHEYRPEVIRERRNQFLEHLKTRTADWLTAQNHGK